MRLRRGTLLILLLGIAASGGSVLAWASCDCAKLPLEAQLARAAVGLAFVLVGAVALNQTATHRVGVLMVIVGLTWFIDDMGWIYYPLPYSFSRLTAAFFQPVLAHLALSFPSGRLNNRVDRAVAIAGYVLWFVVSLALQVVWDPADDGCPACPSNLLLVHRDPGLHDILEDLAEGISLVFTAVVVALVAHHWATASVPRRRALEPVLWSCVPLASVIVVYSVAGRSGMPPLEPLALTVLPAGFLIGLLRIRLNRAALGGLVVELGNAPPPARLRDALASTLHDPSLQVAYWLRERAEFVDDAGRPVELPARDSDRAATLLERNGETIGALIHDVAMPEDPELVEAAAAAARLAIDNERLHAEVKARLQEVRASRTRIAEAATTERKRIERNLHDGSQQRLLTLSMALGLARARLDAEAQPELAAMLGDAAQQLNLAMSELRELARGIHPAILTDAGLRPALQSLAECAPLPVTLHVEVEQRLPEAVEATAYFLVAEALTNAARYSGAARAQVSARLDEARLIVEVSDDGRGGAVADGGSGLQGLADRVGALDGRLEVTSPPGGGTRVVGTIPLSQAANGTS